MRLRFGFLGLFLFAAFALAEDKPVRVAVYIDKGTSASKETVLKVLDKYKQYKPEHLKAEDIREGKLKDFAILIVPGGSGSAQGKALEEKGREEIRKFVKEGGNYVGICAGSYLATNDYEWSLGILNAKVVDRKHWARGHGPVQIEFTDKGRQALKAKDKAEIIYWQGPLLAPGESKGLPAFDALARYETEIAENGASPGVMKGTVAIAAAPYGKGRVLCFGPHPEKKDETNDLLKFALEWVNGKR